MVCFLLGQGDGSATRLHLLIVTQHVQDHQKIFLLKNGNGPRTMKKERRMKGQRDQEGKKREGKQKKRMGEKGETFIRARNQENWMVS